MSATPDDTPCRYQADPAHQCTTNQGQPAHGDQVCYREARSQLTAEPGGAFADTDAQCRNCGQAIYRPRLGRSWTSNGQDRFDGTLGPWQHRFTRSQACQPDGGPGAAYWTPDDTPAGAA